MLVHKKPEESDFDYHRRLVFGKLVDKTLSDVDYTELSQYVYGQSYSSDVARRMMYGSCRTLQLLDSVTDQDVNGDELSKIEAKIIELKKEQQKYRDQRSALNKVIREQARVEELRTVIEDSIKNVHLPSLEYVDRHKIDHEPSDNDLLVSLGDIHYGACVSNHWCKFNSDICGKMFSLYLDKILKIADTHNSQNCIVYANGDLISGNIHHQITVSNKENIIEQIVGVSEMIAAFLSVLSLRFEKVMFVSVAGNHSRIDQKDRALPEERLDDLVEWYLRARLKDLKNVVIGYGNKIDCTMYYINIRGKNYVGVHGDYDPSPSHIQTLQTMVGVPVYAVLLGHVHHSCSDTVQGIKTVTAGSFLGMDSHCVSRRLYGRPEQTVLVCDNEGIRCNYTIDLSKASQQDEV